MKEETLRVILKGFLMIPSSMRILWLFTSQKWNIVCFILHQHLLRSFY